MQCQKRTGLRGRNADEVDAPPVGPDPQPVRGLLEQQEHPLVRFTKVPWLAPLLGWTSAALDPGRP
jgi:hypothetical protein